MKTEKVLEGKLFKKKGNRREKERTYENKYE